METSKQKKISPFFNDISPIITPKSNISNSFISNKDNIYLSIPVNSGFRNAPKSFSSREITSSKKDLPNISKTHTTTNESFSLDQKINSETFKYTPTYESLRPVRIESFEKEEETKFQGKKNENLEIIEYEEFSPNHSINHSMNNSERFQTPPQKHQHKFEEVKNEMENKKENTNEKRFIKHLLSEVKKYSTFANSYKTENESLKEKVKFLMTKMSIKDKKIEEITKLLNNNTLNKLPNEKGSPNKLSNFEVENFEKITQNYQIQIEHYKSLMDTQKMVLEEKEKQNSELSEKMEDLLKKYNEIFSENIQIKHEIKLLHGELENYKNCEKEKKPNGISLLYFKNHLEQQKEEEKMLNSKKEEKDASKIHTRQNTYSCDTQNTKRKNLSLSPYKLLSENLLFSEDLGKNEKKEFEDNKESNKKNQNLIKPFNSSDNFFKNKNNNSNMKEENIKNDPSKSETENSITERIKERQSYKSKSIMDDPRYKSVLSSNHSLFKTKNYESFYYHPSTKNTIKNTTYNIFGNNPIANNSIITLNKNYKIGLDGPQNRINQLADSISFKMRHNQAGSLKNALYEKHLIGKPIENTNKDFTQNSQNNNHFSSKYYNSER